MEGRSSITAFSAIDAIAQAHDFLAGLPLLSSGKAVNSKDVTKNESLIPIIRKTQKLHVSIPSRCQAPAPVPLDTSASVASNQQQLRPAATTLHDRPNYTTPQQAKPHRTSSLWPQKQPPAKHQPQQQEQQQRQQCAVTQTQEPAQMVMLQPGRAWKSTPQVVPVGQIRGHTVRDVACPVGVPSEPRCVNTAAAAQPMDAFTPPSEATRHPSPSEHPILPPENQVLMRIKQLMQPTNVQEHKFYSDCYSACQAVGGLADGSVSIPKLALELRAKGHRVVVRKVLDSKAYWTKSMTNMFCYSLLPRLEGGYIVEPNFRNKLATAFMTERFRDIWECLPAIFVGRATHLAPLLQLLCQERSASFDTDERIVPPWRTYAATIARWLSNSFTDIPLPPPPPHFTARATADPSDSSSSELSAILAFQEKCEQLCAVDLATSARGSKTKWYRTSSGTWVSVDNTNATTASQHQCESSSSSSRKPNGDDESLDNAEGQNTPPDKGTLLLKVVVARSGARRNAEVLMCSPLRVCIGFDLPPGNSVTQDECGTSSDGFPGSSSTACRATSSSCTDGIGAASSRSCSEEGTSATPVSDSFGPALTKDATVQHPVVAEAACEALCEVSSRGAITKCDVAGSSIPKRMSLLSINLAGGIGLS